MVNQNSSADHNAAASSNPTDLEQRLGLYRVFLKVYEHHRELLDEILDLENTDRNRVRGVWQYMQAAVEPDQVVITTNLLQGKTQRLLQPQNCWIIGRDRKIGLCVQDKRLSRRHAMIQYVQGQGFYLSDLNSTNGTFLNGEPVRRAVLLKDGDRIRLGSLSFLFFVTTVAHTLPTIPIDLMDQQISTPTLNDSPESAPIPVAPESAPTDSDDVTSSGKETLMFPLARSETAASEPETPDLSTDQKSEILDRFLNR